MTNRTACVFCLLMLMLELPLHEPPLPDEPVHRQRAMFQRFVSARGRDLSRSEGERNAGEDAGGIAVAMKAI